METGRVGVVRRQTLDGAVDVTAAEHPNIKDNNWVNSVNNTTTTTFNSSIRSGTNITVGYPLHPHPYHHHHH